MWANIDVKLKNILPFKVLQQRYRFQGCDDVLLDGTTQTEAELDASAES